MHTGKHIKAVILLACSLEMLTVDGVKRSKPLPCTVHIPATGAAV